MNLETAFAEITRTLRSAHEWLLVRRSGKSFALAAPEIEITCEREKILCAFLDDAGFQIWRVAGYKIEDENLTLDVVRNFGRATDKIRFVPRTSAAELSRAVELARLERANRIAALLVGENPESKLARVALNEEHGRFAEVVLETRAKRTIRAVADVSDTATPEALLTNAVFQFAGWRTRGKKPIGEIWILAETKRYKPLRKLHALLNDTWKAKIVLKEIARAAADAPRQTIKSPKPLKIDDLWRARPSPMRAARNAEDLSRAAQQIVNLAPDKIDAVWTRHGETVRFFGLPFARVRTIGGAERVWFGTERARRILNEETGGEFFDLIENLNLHRRFDAPNRRHDFFRRAPEAWLEAVLRRDVRRLDGNLILSPLYHQFRAGGGGSDRIDLLALRKDGRLVVVELKVAPDREMIYQAADYWRQIELHRRNGNLRRARIFGDAEITDRPAIVYLAAPTLSFHSSFELIAETVAPEIEIYRFDLNENWRENLKVMKTEKVKSEKFRIL